MSSPVAHTDMTRASLSDREEPRKKLGDFVLAQSCENAIMNRQCLPSEVVMNIRGWELIIILFIVLLLFGPGRLSRIAGEIGRGIREFRSGLKVEDGEAEESAEKDQTEDPGS